MRITMYFAALMTSLCSSASDREAATTLGALGKAKLPMDVVEEWFQPSLNAKTRKVQQLINDICGTPGIRALECDLHKQDITDIDGVVWPRNLVKINLSGNKIAKLSQKNLDAFPKTLKILHLADNKLNLLKDVTFPDNIELLYMENNNGLTFNNVRLPNHLEYLDLSNSQLTYDSLLNINWKSLSKLDCLHIQNNRILFNHEQDVVRFPESLRELVIDYETLDSIIRNEQDCEDEDKFNANRQNLKTVWVSGASTLQCRRFEHYLPNCVVI